MHGVFLAGAGRGGFTLQYGELLALDGVSYHGDGEGAVEGCVTAWHVDDGQHGAPRLRRRPDAEDGVVRHAVPSSSSRA